MQNRNMRAILYALAAALFYALNVPCSKLLRKDIGPTFMAALLYLGAGANASLLGNFEIVATTLIALWVFHEKVSARLWAAIGLITAASMLLSFEGTGSLITACLLRETAPALRFALPAMLLGFVACGLSIFTDIHAQKTLGAARMRPAI